MTDDARAAAEAIQRFLDDDVLLPEDAEVLTEPIQRLAIDPAVEAARREDKDVMLEMRKALELMESLFAAQPPLAVPAAPTMKHESGLVPVMQARNKVRAVLHVGTRSLEDLFIEHAHEGDGGGDDGEAL